MLRLPFSKYPSFGVDNPEYAYACGRVRALEPKLMDRVRLERLSTAKDFEDLLKLLQDTEYAKYLNEIHKPSDYEVLLRRENEKLLSLISELAVDPWVEEDLRLPYDFLNVKVYVKSIIFEKDFSSAFSRFSYYPVTLMKHAFEAGKYDTIPGAISRAYENAISSFYERKEIFRIDTAVDREMFKYFCSESRIEFLRIYYSIKADLQNILTCLRLERMGRTGIMKAVLLPCGFLPSELFFKVSDFNALLHEIRQTPYYEVIAPGYAIYQKVGNFVRIERDLANYLNGLIKEASKKDLGVETLLAYYFKKKNEIALLRMIMVSKLNELPRELVLERIPEVL